MTESTAPRYQINPGETSMPNPVQRLGGAAQLALDCAGGLLRAVEQMHMTIANGPMRWVRLLEPSLRTPGSVAGQIYGLLQSAHNQLAGAATRGIRSVASASVFLSDDASGSAFSESILNGICGDFLEATQNPLAIQMSLRTLAGPIEWTPDGIGAAYAHLSPHIAVWVHGLCLSEEQWVRDGRTMGARLSEELDLTPVYVRYNSGRHISVNGRELSDHLERMVQTWPLSAQSVTLIGHSMGGLVVRSAAHYGDRDNRAWRDKLRNVICLGTPHHGSPLEKGGDLLTRAMQANPYLDPLAFGRARSAGIRDLRHGNLLDEDWQLAESDPDRRDQRTPVPPLADVNYYFGAATVGPNENDPMSRVLGDLLVQTASAIGAHADKRKEIAIPAANCRIFRNMNHFDLLGHPQVYAQLVRWLAPDRFSGSPVAPNAGFGG
jgi:pimeloyl-ACP methyl ester carboxylesterase